MRWVPATARHIVRDSPTPALSPRWAERESAGNVPGLLPHTDVHALVDAGIPRRDEQGRITFPFNEVSPVPAAALVAGGDGVMLRIRLRPGASRNAVLGRSVLANGDEVVTAAVSAPPEDGKANASLIQLLAKIWRQPKTGVTIIGGATARNKLLHIAGPPAALMVKLGTWLDTLPVV